MYNAEASHRASAFYNVTYTPWVNIDGIYTSGNYQNAIVNRMNQPAPVTEKIWGSYFPSRGTGTVYAQFRNDSSATMNARAYFVIIEDSCYYVAPNGDSWHNDVARDYLPSDTGVAVTIASGDSIVLSRDFTINESNWQLDMCRIYAWIQRPTGNKEVFQSAIIKVDEMLNAPMLPEIVSPFNYVRLPDLQPTLSFTSIDPQADQIQYQVVWDTDPAFGSPESILTPLYASGQVAIYVLGVPLANNTTYWWKVKCWDPSGSATWSGFTDPRSLSTATSMLANSCSWFQTTNAQFAACGLTATLLQGDSIILNPSPLLIIDTLLFSGFEGTTLPSGWTVIDGNGDNFKWQNGTTSDIGAFTPPNYGTKYAFYSDNDAGSGVLNYNEELITPTVFTGNATSLQLMYSFGMRINQTGERMRTKLRTFTAGTWSNWIVLATYQSSGTGAPTLSLNSYLPCDSMQFEWFYSDSTTALHYGYACAVDNVTLRDVYTSTGNEGSVTATPVVFSELSKVYPRDRWGSFIWYKGSAGDSIGIKVEYYDGQTWYLIPDSDLPGNGNGFFSNVAADTVDLRDLDTLAYNTIRLIGLFYRIVSDAPGEPVLHAWEVGNMAPVPGIAISGSNHFQSGLTIRPSVTRNTVRIDFSVADCSKDAAINIYDATGRKVRSFKVIAGEKASSLSWDCHDEKGNMLANGIYFVQLSNADNHIMKKVVIAK